MEMLKNNDILGFGKLLTASHMSLENDYMTFEKVIEIGRAHV